jgi:ABC-type molybdenum transport system ATPase subunit/photorepair protein PhrA
MNINVEESIEGLWVANERSSYLAFWFPILEKPNGNFIGIKPGMNVIYGVNGSGKTQLLEAISSAAEFRISTFEGFILKDPILEGAGQEPDRKLYDTSALEVLNYFDSISEDRYSVDMMLGWIKGYRPENLTDENRKEVEAIISEFINHKKCLLTRAIPEDKMLFDRPDARESMNPARSIDFVPILFPTDEAPITRSHLEKISQSFFNFQENLEDQLEGILNLHLEDENTIEEKKTELFEVWLQSWNWSPLVNLRNFSFLTNYSYELFEGFNNSEFGFLNSEELPVFLPSIHSHLNRIEYQEFKGEEFESNFALSLKREDSTPEEISEEKFSITNSDIGFSAYGKSEKADRSILVSEYLVNLQKKLKFLPGLRMLTIDFERLGDDEKIPLLLQGKPRVRASAGSQAERRWLMLGKKAMRQSTKWLVIDEPESGMHRTAEVELAGVLSSPEWASSNILVVATHSPEFLNLPNVNVIHVVKGSTYSLTKIDREKFVDLGVRPSDLLAGTKIFFLVEGEHEKIIFETMFKDELERMKCRIIVARGAKNMKDIFESQFIFDFTDAVILSLLDNIDSKYVENVWIEAKKLAQTGKITEAGEYVRQSLPGSKSGENVFLSQFLTLALVNGEHERVEVYGLSKLDIVFYFEPSDFGLKKSWKELMELNLAEKQSFKSWATKKYNADFSILAIEKAALNCHTLPDEFGEMMMKLADITKR